MKKYLLVTVQLRKQWQEYEDICQVNVDDNDGNYNAKHTSVKSSRNQRDFSSDNHYRCYEKIENKLMMCILSVKLTFCHTCKWRVIFSDFLVLCIKNRQFFIIIIIIIII